MPVFAYTNDPAHYGDRVTADGLAVEAFDLADNLMLDGAVRGGIVRLPTSHVLVPAVAGDDPPLLTDLHAFEQCVQRAAAALA